MLKRETSAVTVYVEVTKEVIRIKESPNEIEFGRADLDSLRLALRMPGKNVETWSSVVGDTTVSVAGRTTVEFVRGDVSKTFGCTYYKLDEGLGEAAENPEEFVRVQWAQ